MLRREIARRDQPERAAAVFYGGTTAGHQVDMETLVGVVSLGYKGSVGDHLGYYSLAHEFPVLKVDRVYHRQDAVWPFIVGSVLVTS